tara:strand:+ start:1581 stop:2402 length:822 start_codon:yes stop_codon:yes gene_type:complete
MKYGYYEENESPLAIKEYTDGAHIIVIRAVNNFISTSIKLEDEGWELRDSIKVILQNTSLHATLFRKPFKGTVANNVLENGCGGINIDVSRITYQTKSDLDSVMNPTLNTKKGKKHTAGAMTGGINRIDAGNSNGRFPANLLLECTCEEVIEGKSDGVVINNKNSQSINDTIYKLGHSKGEQEAPRAYKDTGATHTNSNCPCKKMDSQSGDNSSTRINNPKLGNKGGKMFGGAEQKVASISKDYRDKGGSSRFFFSFKSRDELKEYLTTMIRC